VNSGNANTFTGIQGKRDVRASAEATATMLGCSANEVFVASTGVIGERLPVARVIGALPGMGERLGSNAWQAAATAIGTTDTFPKGATRSCKLAGTPVVISGIAKGSGMIAPNMATMLAFVFTDAQVPAPTLQALLKQGIDRSFHCITVDSDTSTSDTVLLSATGVADNRPPSSHMGREIAEFKRALEEVLVDLATQVVRDGEGASKFITIDVSGAISRHAARQVGLSIANSPLVKTAIAGEDANWGRVVMAIGKAGVQIDLQRMTIAIGGVVIARDGGQAIEFDESVVTSHLKGKEVSIQVNLGVGRASARVWTCDLTHEYIRINAEYRS
jgi:glutamate N-acetyltransferase/amino-acid N-acetyltransferase